MSLFALSIKEHRMQKWLIKAVVQGAMSRLPGGQSLNCLCQKVFKRWNLPPNRFEQKLIQCRGHLDSARADCDRPAAAFTVLDLGTGCYPVVPVGMYLCGASVVWTIDIVPLLNRPRLKQVIDFFVRYHREKRLVGFLPSVQPERIDELEKIAQSIDSAATAAEVLKQININASVGDVRNMNLAEKSIDFFISNCVLEHIPPEILVEILRKFRKVAAPGAVMSHSVDLSDHYADFDRSITVYNFLKYSERAWRWFNNPLHYQNRLRPADYRDIHKKSGFRIVAEHTSPGYPDVLDQVKLAPEFRRYSRDDLLVTRARFVAMACGCESGECEFSSTENGALI